MSTIYTIKTNTKIEFKDIFDNLIKNYSNLSAYEEDDKNVFFYLNGISIRGVYIKNIKTGFEIKSNVLSNKQDLILTNDILKYVSEKTNGKIFGEENNLLSGNELINKNELENNFERDLETVFTLIKETGDTIEFPGTTRSFFIGKKLYSTYNDFSKNMKIEVLQKIILNVLYGLPDYYECSPMGAQSKQDDKIIKLKSISSDENYIIQDYDYIMIENTKNDKEIIMISKEKIYNILPKNWNIVDESTIVAHKLSQNEWNDFINICIKENCYNEFKIEAK
jgi:hypothetical protein